MSVGLNAGAKQKLGLEGYELRNPLDIRRHWLMVLLAHNLLQLSSRKGEPLAWIKTSLKMLGSRCR